jgi:dTDP-4-dehydrorhamnose 3,5-epimerase-like enzyme
MRTKKNPKITTTSKDGEENGFLIPIINVHEHFVDEEQWPQQVYCTVVEPSKVKGPHLHHMRWGLFTCIRGNVKVVVKGDEGFEEYLTGDDHEYRTIQVPAGIPAAIVNMGDEDAYVLNMPTPSWHPDDQDDWDVEFEDYHFFGKDGSAALEED